MIFYFVRTHPGLCPNKDGNFSRMSLFALKSRGSNVDNREAVDLPPGSLDPRHSAWLLQTWEPNGVELQT